MPKWGSRDFHGKGTFIMNIAKVGLDLAKNVPQVHTVDSQGHIVVRKQLRRTDVLRYFATLEPCVIGMEACGSSPYWGHELAKLGHTSSTGRTAVRRPYVKSNKTDAADAEAICEAIQRPNMRFVPVKTQAQQTILSLHRARAGLVKSRTALANQIRGLLGEFGIVLPQGIRLLGQRAMEALSSRDREYCEPFRTLIQMLVEHLRELGNKVAELEGRIRAIHRTDAPDQLLETIPGWGAHRIGPSGADRRRPSLSQRPRTCCLAGSGAAPAFLGRHAASAGHQQARRYGITNTSDSRRPCSYPHGRREDRDD
ncbi:transposase [Paraburkholderia youngii]